MDTTLQLVPGCAQQQGTTISHPIAGSRAGKALAGVGGAHMQTGWLHQNENCWGLDSLVLPPFEKAAATTPKRKSSTSQPRGPGEIISPGGVRGSAPAAGGIAFHSWRMGVRKKVRNKNCGMAKYPVDKKSRLRHFRRMNLNFIISNIFNPD
jgi:hypothetical protein